MKPGGPLTLFDLESLTHFCDATVLFDKVVFLDCHQPTIRFENAPLSREETTKQWLQNNLGWNFFDCDQHISKFPSSEWLREIVWCNLSMNMR